MSDTPPPAEPRQAFELNPGGLAPPPGTDRARTPAVTLPTVLPPPEAPPFCNLLAVMDWWRTPAKRPSTQTVSRVWGLVPRALLLTKDMLKETWIHEQGSKDLAFKEFCGILRGILARAPPLIPFVLTFPDCLLRWCSIPL